MFHLSFVFIDLSLSMPYAMTKANRKHNEGAKINAALARRCQKTPIIVIFEKITNSREGLGVERFK